jgi:hypothetical protein
MYRLTPKRRLAILLLMAAAGCADIVDTDSAICDADVQRKKLSSQGYDRVDLLFVLDDSPSMAQERKHFLERQLPRAMQLLLHGQTTTGAPVSFSPPRNLHVGVISSDMGVGADGVVSDCSGSGDDARLLNGAQCGALEPGFVWYYDGKDDPDATASAVQCIADVGNSGCQVSQPLEAALKALWPAGSADWETHVPVPSDRYRFRGDSDGHGLQANAGFLRSEGALSQIIVIILTDQDDCSIDDLTTFTSDPSQPASGEAAALGCLRNPDKLRAIQTYVGGFRALRPGSENLMTVGIIAGVPPEWVSSVLEPARQHFADTTQLRGAFDALLADPRMQADPSGAMPSCSSAIATATAPRRLMQFARNSGPSAFVQSICDYDLAAMMAEMFPPFTRSYGNVGLCTLRSLVPDHGELLPCRITWELPESRDPEEPLTPASCAERPDLLSEPGAGFPKRSQRGRVLCEVRQAPLMIAADGSRRPTGEGFFADPKRSCGTEYSQIVFTEHANPPPGVTLNLECVDLTQHAPPMVAGGPAIGDACLEKESLRGADALCGNATGDHGAGKLFCQPATNRCVLGCRDESQCPAGWVCDAEDRICVRPGCE